MKPSLFLTLLVGILMMQTSTFAQFQYIGVDGQFYGMGGSTSSFTTSLNYLKQLTSHHGLGVELGLPVAIDNPARHVPIDTFGYDAGLIWKRQYLPYVGFRYRFFASNSFFLGVLANVGLMRERFYADRYFRYSEAYTQEAIPPVYYDYVIKSPFFRATFEMGLLLNLGERMYGTFHGRLGFQYTKAPIQQFGTYSVGYELPTYQFDAYQGLGITGGLNFGLGLKL